MVEVTFLMIMILIPFARESFEVLQVQVSDDDARLKLNVIVEELELLVALLFLG